MQILFFAFSLLPFRLTVVSPNPVGFSRSGTDRVGADAVDKVGV